MLRLSMLLFSIISTTLMGAGIVIALVSGNDTLWPIVISAVLGFLIAIPASWIVARQIA